MGFLLLPSMIATAQQKKQITFDDLFNSEVFTVKGVPGFKMLKNGQDYTRLNDNKTKIIAYHLADGKEIKSLFEKPEEMADIISYSFSEDEQKMLLFTEIEPIYRRSALYKVYVYDLTQQKLSRLSDEKVMHATFNPQGTQVAFVKDNNLYLKDLASDQVQQVTKDGQKNKIINGSCDWVYEEEFSFTKAFAWSPDGRYVAYYRFDESAVKDYTILLYNDSNYPEPYTFKYPKAGEANSEVTIHIYDVQEKNSRAAHIGDEKDQYIPRIQWTNEGNHLCIFRMNRLQNRLDILLEEAASGIYELIYSEENKYYIDINNRLTEQENLLFLPDHHSFIINSERSGYNQLYIWDWKKMKLFQITHGEWDVEKVVGYDAEQKILYYTAAKIHPTQRELYKISLNGKKEEQLTKEAGYHQISEISGNHYFLDRFSRINEVPVYRLLNRDGHVVRILEDNHELAQSMRQYDIAEPEFTTFENPDGIALNAWIIKPPQFDPQKRYPVLMFQYSGPGSQQVLDQFPVGHYFWHQMMAQKGYIIVCVDGIGTGMRGWEFQNQTYLQLGKYESRDQIAVAKTLANLPYVDNQRMGIWGWSYGGFMSATCLFKGHDVFKTAVSVAPVTNWRYYDNIYTERYMRRPIDNPKGYDDNAPESMVANLKGHLLIIHGLADDNVHFQNAAELTKRLVEANKQFESTYYPNKNHGISGGKTREQLFRRITDYLLEKL